MAVSFFVEVLEKLVTGQVAAVFDNAGQSAVVDIGFVAEAVLPLGAKEEKAVAATKTYLNTLAALVLLAGYIAGDIEGARCAGDVREVAGLLDAAIPQLQERVSEIALPFAFVGRMFVVGRGVEFATAREIALKLLEACRVAAEPLTAHCHDGAKRAA